MRTRKICKRSCTAFWKLMCVRTQRSSEEAFRFFRKSFPILGRSLPGCGRVAPQTHFGKAFRIAASILKMRTLSSAPAHCFFATRKSSQGTSNLSLKTYMAHLQRHLCMHTNHLATKCHYYSRLLKQKYGWCSWRQGESLSSIVDSAFEQNLVNDSSAKIAYIYCGSL